MLTHSDVWYILTMTITVRDLFIVPVLIVSAHEMIQSQMTERMNLDVFVHSGLVNGADVGGRHPDRGSEDCLSQREKA